MTWLLIGWLGLTYRHGRSFSLRRVHCSPLSLRLDLYSIPEVLCAAWHLPPGPDQDHFFFLSPDYVSHSCWAWQWMYTRMGCLCSTYFSSPLPTSSSFSNCTNELNQKPNWNSAERLPCLSCSEFYVTSSVF